MRCTCNTVIEEVLTAKEKVNSTLTAEILNYLHEKPKYGVLKNLDMINDDLNNTT